MIARSHAQWAPTGASAALVLFLCAGTLAQSEQPASTTPDISKEVEQAVSEALSGQKPKSDQPAPRSTSKPNTYTKSGSASAVKTSPAAAVPVDGAGADPQAAATALQEVAKAIAPQIFGPGSTGSPASSPVNAPADAAFPEQVPVYDQATPDAEPALSDGSQVNVSEYMTVDMFVQDEDLANVLQMLSLQSRRNIVASRDIDAKVTANLYGVTFYEALDSILNVNGYGYVEKGNFVYVYTLEELELIQAQDRRMVSKVINLNYLNANDAAEFVSPLLSENGKIKTNGDVGSFTIPTDSPTGDEQFALGATLVIFDYEEHIAEIEALLDQLDTKPAQVLVEATILQTSLNEANAFGVDFAFLNSVELTDFFDFGGALGAANVLNQGEDFLPSDNRGSAVVTTPGNTGGPGTFKLSILHDDIALFIRALDQVSDVNIVSNPKILALNRQSAKVSIGRKIGYLKSTTNNGVTEQDVEFLPTGTSLAFRPFISKDGLIRLELKPKVSEGIINEFTDNEGRTVTVPDEVSQEITTNVVVPDGSTVVLGGLFREATTLTRTQVPVLGDIPLIGAAFRGTDDTTDRSEIIFLIKPTIVNDQILLSQGEEAIEYAERVRVGSRQGLLPWSRDRQTSQLNVQAERLAAEGKTDLALHSLRRSLELNPSQPEVYKMQQELGGSNPEWTKRSLLDRIIHDEATRRTGVEPGQPEGQDDAQTQADPSQDQASAVNQWWFFGNPNYQPEAQGAQSQAQVTETGD